MNSPKACWPHVPLALQESTPETCASSSWLHGYRIKECNMQEGVNGDSCCKDTPSACRKEDERLASAAAAAVAIPHSMKAICAASCWRRPSCTMRV